MDGATKNKEKYLTPKEVTKILKVSTKTLHNWNCQGILKAVRTKGGHRRYVESDVYTKAWSPHQLEEIQKRKRRICYCRVSTPSQREDLERQALFFSTKYPEHEIIKDIGSGINFKRKGFNSILESAINGDIGEVVVTHRDRLCRFGFELIQRIIEQHSNGAIVVLNQDETSPEKELVNDLLSIITVFSSRLYGLRSHSLKKKIKEEASKRNPESETGETNQNIENETVPV